MSIAISIQPIFNITESRPKKRFEYTMVLRSDVSQRQRHLWKGNIRYSAGSIQFTHWRWLNIFSLFNSKSGYKATPVSGTSKFLPEYLTEVVNLPYGRTEVWLCNGQSQRDVQLSKRCRHVNNSSLKRADSLKVIKKRDFFTSDFFHNRVGVADYLGDILGPHLPQRYVWSNGSCDI